MPTLDGVNKTFCVATQSPRSFSVDTNSSILTNGQSIGLTVSVLSYTIQLLLSRVQLIVEASFLSFGATIAIFILIAVRSISFGCAVQHCMRIWILSLQRNLLRYRKTLPNGDWKLLRTPADIYMVCSMLTLLSRTLILAASQLSLFVYDNMLAIGGILNTRWAHDGIVTTGPYCTAQGILKQIGAVGVALITLVRVWYGSSVHCTDAQPTR